MKRVAVDFPFQPDAERRQHLAPAFEVHRFAIHQYTVEIEEDRIVRAHLISVYYGRDP